MKNLKAGGKDCQTLSRRCLLCILCTVKKCSFHKYTHVHRSIYAIPMYPISTDTPKASLSSHLPCLQEDLTRCFKVSPENWKPLLGYAQFGRLERSYLSLHHPKLLTLSRSLSQGDQKTFSQHLDPCLHELACVPSPSLPAHPPRLFNASGAFLQGREGKK